MEKLSAVKKTVKNNQVIMSPGKILLRATLLALVFVAIFLLITVLALAGFGYARINKFAKVAQVSKPELWQTTRAGWQQTPFQTAQHKNILLLGLDSLETRGSSLPLTDTMMLISINLDNGQIKTLSLPRDLYHQGYKTKINALYTYGLDRYPEQPEQFPTEVISEMTGLPIHHTLVLSMENISQMIDLLSGIELDVKTGFVDEEFPRSDVDVTVETDPAKLYERVEFKSGSQTMNGETALKYMRSRHSGDDEGTDLARAQRQQQVISAVAAKLFQRSTLTDPVVMGELYRFYLDNYGTDLPPQELIATLKKLFPLRQQIKLESQSLSIYPDDKQGVITHPPTYLYQGQWVYQIRDQEQFEQELQTKLTK